MKKMVRHLILLTIVSMLILSGCSKKEDTIKIGSIGPLTGESSIGGLDELDAKRMAVDDFNAKGGVLGKRIELFSEDDASQPSQSASAAMKMINQNNVVAIIGAHNSPCTLAVMEVIEKSGIPIITPGSSSPKITEIGNEWIARSFPSDAIQVKGLVNYSLDIMKNSRIGIIYVNDDYGKGGYNAVKAALESRGESLVGAETFMGEDRDMRAQLTKLQASGADALFIWCQYFPGSLIMKQVREMDWDVQFYTGTGLIHQKVFELAGEVSQGTIQSVPFIPNVPDPDIQEWVKRYVEKYGKEPSQNSARAYDATMILLNAIERAESTEPKAIRDAMRNTKDLQGKQGKITINPDTGEYIGEVMIVKIEGSGWAFIDKVAPE